MDERIKNLSTKELRQMFRGEHPDIKKGTKDVTLPNGQVYENVPEDVSQAEVLERALSDGAITVNEFKSLVSNWTDYKDVLQKFEPKPVQPTQGEINQRRLADAAGKTADIIGMAYDTNVGAIRQIPVVGDTVGDFIDGAVGGMANVVEGTGQAITDLYGRVTGNDVSDRLNAIDEFRHGRKQNLPDTTASTIGEFSSYIVPFTGGPTKILPNMSIGAILGGTNYQEDTMLPDRETDRVTSALIGAAIPVGVQGAMKGLRDTVSGVKNVVSDVAAKESLKEKAVEAVVSPIARAASYAEDILDATPIVNLTRPNTKEKVAARRRELLDSALGDTAKALKMSKDPNFGIVRKKEILRTPSTNVAGLGAKFGYTPTAVDILLSGLTQKVVAPTTVAKFAVNAKPVVEKRVSLRRQLPVIHDDTPAVAVPRKIHEGVFAKQLRDPSTEVGKAANSKFEKMWGEQPLDMVDEYYGRPVGTSMDEFSKANYEQQSRLVEGLPDLKQRVFNKFIDEEFTSGVDNYVENAAKRDVAKADRKIPTTQIPMMMYLTGED